MFYIPIWRERSHFLTRPCESVTIGDVSSTQSISEKLMQGLGKAGHGVAPVAAGCASSLLICVWAWPGMVCHAAYPEPVVGLGTWYDDAKAQDFRGAELAMALGVLLTVLFGLISNRVTGSGVDPDDRRRRSDGVKNVWCLALIPAVSWLGHSFAQPIGLLPSKMAIAGVLGAAAIIGAMGV